MNLEQTLLAHDFITLRAIAAQAGLELDASSPRAAAAELAAVLKQPEIFDLFLARVVNLPLSNNQPTHNLPAVLAALQSKGARHPAAAFIRRFGDLRPLGSAALARERPWEKPATPTEALFFNGLIGRAFMDSETGPQEFFYIPADLVALLPAFVESASPGSAAQVLTPAAADSVEPRFGRHGFGR